MNAGGFFGTGVLLKRPNIFVGQGALARRLYSVEQHADAAECGEGVKGCRAASRFADKRFLFSQGLKDY